MSGLTPEEQHFFESGGDTSRLNEPNITPTPQPTPPSDYTPLDTAGLGNVPPPEPVAPSVVAPPTIVPPTPPVVPQQPDATEIMRQALAEAQRTAAELQVRLEQATAQPKTPPVAVPDPDTDPLGNMLHQLDQVNKNVADLQTRLLEQQTQQQQVNAFQQFQKQVVTLRDQFKVTAPDFDAAYQHLRDARAADLRTYGVPEADIAKQIFQDEVVLSESALKQGRNPAEAVYEMAKRHGYVAGVPKAAAAPALPSAKLNAVKAGAAATQPSSLPSNPVSEDITVESLKDASDADLNKLVTDPAAWAKIAGGNNIPI